MAPTATRRRSATKPVEPEVVVEETEDEFEELEDDTEAVDETGDEDELEELAEDDEEPAPVKKTTKAATKKAPAAKPEEPKFNTAWLAAYVTETTGKSYDGRAIRMLLRKLASDGKLARKVGEDRDRYTFPTAEKDPIVVQVVKMITSGEAAKLKQAGLDKVKEQAAAKKAAAKAKKDAEAAEDAAEELDDSDVEDEEVEETPAPKPRATRRAATTAKAAAPAKAAPVRRTARAKS